MSRRIGVQVAATGLVLLASASVHLQLRSAAAQISALPERPNQPTGTALPTHWQAEAGVVGRVVAADSTDTPIEGARVILHAGDNRCDWSVVTDATGAFALSCYDLHFENGYVVHVVAEDNHPWQSGGLLYGRIELQPELVRIVTTPRPTPTPFDVAAYVITKGTVRDAADGRPLPHVRVGVGSPPNCLTPVRSDEAGGYELVCPYVGELNRYRLTALLGGYADWSRELPGHELGDVIDIELERAGAQTPTATPQAEWRLWIPASDVSRPGALAARASRRQLSDRPPGPLITPTVTESPTLLPLDPTPQGGSLDLGSPLATPTLSRDAISPANADRLVAVGGWAGEDEVPVRFTLEGRGLVTSDFDSYQVRILPNGYGRGEAPARWWSFRPYPGALDEVALTLDGRWAISANGTTEGHVDIWSTDDARPARTHRGGQRVQGLGLDPWGDLLIASRVDQYVTVWDLRSGSVVQHMRIGGSVTLDPRLGEVAAVLDGDVKVWDLLTGDELRNVPQAALWASPCALSYSPDGTWLAGAACASEGAATVSVWAPGGAQTDLPLEAAWGPELQWSPDGRKLAILVGRRLGDTYWEEFRVWDGAELATLVEPGTTVGTFDWSPDSRMIAAAMAGPDYERSVVLWDVEAGEKAAELPDRTQPVFSPDGAYLAAGIPDHGPELYAVPSPTPTATATPTPGCAGTCAHFPAAYQSG